jgi:hypothetical protein
MAITLVDSTLHEVRKDGDGTFQVTAGKHLKIETSPGGEEILDVIVPEGKVWTVTLSVRVIEEDV